ncbi:MAG: hypothetical protein JW936_07505 [Sedimentisphaerales bacterium]|nr:hypothetical protein [Sedimentisphaerales bacterium]
MSDFFQNGIITTLHDFQTDNLEKTEAVLGNKLKRRDTALVLPIIPRDLNAPSFQEIVNELAEATYISEVILSLGQTDKFDDMVAACRALKFLPQKHTVVWSSGPGVKKLYDELADNHLDVGKDGKGRGVWTAMGYAFSNRELMVIAMHDCDIRNYNRRMLARLCYPCAARGLNFEFTKAYYMRVSDRIYGRVTRLFFTPLIRSLQLTVGQDDFLSFLHSFRYPLSGEVSMRRSLAQVLHMPGDWGLEIGTLSEVYKNCSMTRVCQVDIASQYEHKHQDLGFEDNSKGLLRMSTDIAKVLLRILASHGVVFPAHFFEALEATYLAAAREAIAQYDADAKINGIPYDRHNEAQAVEGFSQAIRLGTHAFLREPTDMPRIPAWHRVMSAMPDFLDRLRATVTEENEAAIKRMNEQES